MIIGLVHDGAEPVEEIQNLRPADAGEEIFVAAGEADHFVRKHRADDDDLVVIENEPVDFDGHIHREQTAGELADFLRGMVPISCQRGGIVPFVIEESDVPIFAAAFFYEISNRLQMASSLIGGMRAESHQHIQSFRDPADRCVQRLEHHADGRGARAVGNDEQHAFCRDSCSGHERTTIFRDFKRAGRAFSVVAN